MQVRIFDTNWGFAAGRPLRYYLAPRSSFDMREGKAASGGGLKQSGIAAFMSRAPKNPSPPSPPPPTAPPVAAERAPPPSALVLNPEQQQAAKHGTGLVCVEAGPGSGKTRVIAARAEYLCTTQNVPGYRILVLTFSNKAASELQARVLPRAPGAQVKTFHSFCALILRQNGAVVGVRSDFKLADAPLQRAVLRDAVRSADAPHGQNDPTSLGAGGKRRPDEGYGDDDGDDDDAERGSAVVKPGNGLLEAVLRCKREEAAAALGVVSSMSGTAASSTSAAAGSDDEQRVRQIASAYTALLAARNALDFDDLLLRGLALLRHSEGGPRVAGRFVHVLVDEFQDTSAIQCELVRATASVHRNATLVGDPNQCIYAWRQAERANLANLAHSWPGGLVRRPLTQSYRSTQRVLAVARTLLASRLVLDSDETIPPDPHAPPAPELWTSNAVGPPVGVHVYADGASEAAGVAHHIKLLLEASTGGVAAAAAAAAEKLGCLSALLPHAHGGAGAVRRLRGSDIAILARTGKQLALVHAALEAAGVASCVSESQRLTERKEAKPILAHLALLLSPTDIDAFERVVRAARGLGDATVKQLLADVSASGASVRPMDALEQIARHNAGGGGGGASAAARKPPSRAVAAAAQAVCVVHAELTRMLDKGKGVDALLRKLIGRVRSEPAAGGGAHAAAPAPASVGFVAASAAATATDAAPPPPPAAAASSTATSAPAADAPTTDPLETLLSLATQHERARREQPAHVDDSFGGVAEARPADDSPARRSLRSFVHGLGLGSESGGGDGGHEVSLCTLHRSKGLEWRLVWILGCEEGLLPFHRSVREGYSTAGAAGAAAVLREERRLLYVGATRAMEALVFSRALERGDGPTRPCPFLRSLRAQRDGGECEPSVFLPPSLAAPLNSLAETVGAAEHEQLGSGHAAAWLRACDARLRAAVSSKPAAHEAAFLISHYGADYAERFAISDDGEGSELDGGDGGDDEESDRVRPPRPDAARARPQAPPRWQPRGVPPTGVGRSSVAGKAPALAPPPRPPLQPASFSNAAQLHGGGGGDSSLGNGASAVRVCVQSGSGSGGLNAGTYSGGASQAGGGGVGRSGIGRGSVGGSSVGGGGIRGVGVGGGGIGGVGVGGGGVGGGGVGGGVGGGGGGGGGGGVPYAPTRYGGLQGNGSSYSGSNAGAGRLLGGRGRGLLHGGGMLSASRTGPSGGGYSAPGAANPAFKRPRTMQ